jgi:hypothetical protein
MLNYQRVMGFNEICWDLTEINGIMNQWIGLREHLNWKPCFLFPYDIGFSCT